MNITLLDAQTLGADLDLSPLKALGELTTYATTKPDETLSRITESEIIITNKVVITADMMASCHKLKLICIAATGMNNVDLESAKELGISVKNVAGYSTQSVVQHTFSMALYLFEKMAYYDAVVKSGEWSDSGIFTDVSRPFGEMAGKKWGVIGLGSIGREVAKIATAFGAEVSYYSTTGSNLDQEYKHQDLETLLSECDIISIHCPLNDQTLDLINKTNLSLLKDNALLLNLGRGGIINEADLAKELDSRSIFIGLDVIAKEPIERSNPLMSIKNPERLLITPHIAWSSKEARVKLLEGIVDNIKGL